MNLSLSESELSCDDVQVQSEQVVKGHLVSVTSENYDGGTDYGCRMAIPGTWSPALDYVYCRC